MKVGEMCSRGVVTALESASLRDVAVLMAERHVGAIVIVSKAGAQPVPVGIITDRDIVRAQLEHVADLSRLRVADVMTKPPLTLTEGEQLEDAIEILRARSLRRAPVVNARGELVGFVSTDDLVAEVARQLGTLAGLLRRQPERGGRYT